MMRWPWQTREDEAIRRIDEVIAEAARIRRQSAEARKAANVVTTFAKNHAERRKQGDERRS